MIEVLKKDNQQTLKCWKKINYKQSRITLIQHNKIRPKFQYCVRVNNIKIF